MESVSTYLIKSEIPFYQITENTARRTGGLSFDRRSDDFQRTSEKYAMERHEIATTFT